MSDRRLAPLDPDLDALLDAERRCEDPSAARERVHRKLAVTLALTSAAGPASATGAVLGGALAWKLAVATLAAALVGGGTYFLVRSPTGAPSDRPVAPAPLAAVSTPVAQPQSALPPSSPAAEQPPAPLPTPPSIDGAPRVAPARTAARLRTRPVPPRTTLGAAAGLDAERALLEQGRIALAAGRPEAALVVARTHADRFEHGQMVDEREALAVRALVAAGRYTEARARAAAFFRRFPGSLQASAVRATIDSLP